MKKIVISISVLLLIFSFPIKSKAERSKPLEKSWDMADRLKKQGKCQQAIEVYKKSADSINRNEKSQLSDLAIIFNETGACYYLLGEYENATQYYQKSMMLNKQLNKQDQVAIQLNNTGLIHYQLAQYDEAIHCFEQSLDIQRKFGNDSMVATSLNNIGGVYSAWGQRGKAMEYHKKALAIDKKKGNDTQIANRLNNIGEIYHYQSQPNKALSHFRQALEIMNKLGNEVDSAVLYNNIGEVYRSRGQYKKALEMYENALDINRRFGRDVDIAGNMNNIGMVYKSLKEYKAAIKYFKKALRVNKRLNRIDRVSDTYANIGKVYYLLKQYDKAIDHIVQSVTIKEKLRKTASGEARRDYLADQIHTYQWLISSFVLNNEVSKAFSAVELSKAKFLADQLAQSELTSPLLTVEDIQQNIPEDTAVITYANVESECPATQIVITKEAITGTELDTEVFVSSTRMKYKKKIDSLLKTKRRKKIVKRQKQKEAIAVDPIGFEDIVNYYKSLIETPFTKHSRGLKKKRTSNTGNKSLSKTLYGYLIRPIENQIKNKKRLIIVPDGILGFLPFETLISDNGNRLVEKFSVSYTQSMGVLNLIKKRSYNKDRKPFIGFGGAVYDEISYSDDRAKNEINHSILEKKINVFIDNNRSMRSVYASLDLISWQNLPGTLEEVRGISKLIPQAKVYSGQDVNETTIKKLSDNGELAKYRIIHFATHGLVVPDMPSLSAIVLSQFKKERNNEDGYLRMGEIKNLNIKADFVNLSACETGIGKIYGGEGVVALTQSFLIGGANGLSVSLWQVADKSTSQFMVLFYELVQKNNTGYAEALNETKRRFIKGDFGDELKKPYYWAPFVYYGL